MAAIPSVFIEQLFSYSSAEATTILSLDSVTVDLDGAISGGVPEGIAVSINSPSSGSVTIAGKYSSSIFNDNIVQYRESKKTQTIVTKDAWNAVPPQTYAITRYYPDRRNSCEVTYTFSGLGGEGGVPVTVIVTQTVFNDYDLMISTFLNALQNQTLGESDCQP
jgi:hypothetical protein